MNPSNSLINGLKSNVARGFSLAEFWGETYKKTVPMLLKSWKLLEVDGTMEVNLLAKVEAMAWEVVNGYTHYQAVKSEKIGILSTIGMKTIPASTYTNKKGEVKTTPEQKFPAHYTQEGDYLGRVSDLGHYPISYTLRLQITPKHFFFGGVGSVVRIEDCFHLKAMERFEEPGEFKVKDISKAERKAEKAEAKPAVAKPAVKCPTVVKRPVLVDDDNSDDE